MMTKRLRKTMMLMMTLRKIRRFHWQFFWTVSIILWHKTVMGTRLMIMVSLFLQLGKRVVKSPQNRQRRRWWEASGKRLPTHCTQKMPFRWWQKD
jgi:hypothetical protein